jgi:nicotinate phosphoribosyltransferase
MLSLTFSLEKIHSKGWTFLDFSQLCNIESFRQFTIFAGLDETLKYVQNFKFSSSDIEFLRRMRPDWDNEFFVFLENLDASKVKIYAIKEGSVVFPRVPLVRVEGPLAVCQIFETAMLNLINFACLMSTNAARHRLVAGKNKTLIEFGLRRAQGPDGAMSA